MNCVEAALLRKTSLRSETMMLSSSTIHHHLPQYQYQHQHLLSSEEAALAWVPLEQSSLLVGEDFSVDDLLDFGGGEGHGEEEEEEEVEEAEEEREESPNNSSSSDLSFQALTASDPIVPAGVIEDLEWVSRYVDDSYSEFPSSAISSPYQQQQHHHEPPPLPLAPKPQTLKTQSGGTTTATATSLKRTWNDCCFSTGSLIVPAKARSKRSRTSGRFWSLCRPPQLAESSSSSCSAASSSSSCSSPSSLSSCLIYGNLVGGGSGGGEDPDRFLDCLGRRPHLKQHQQQLPLQVKKKGRKPKALVAAEADIVGDLQGKRRCSHCGVDKTPQWRAGPMGAKTLCNACGVRYKSGRLLPEYRPAGSPTFLSHVHSNSHRKILEMRRKDLPDAAYSSSPLLLPPLMQAATQPHGVV